MKNQTIAVGLLFVFSTLFFAHAQETYLVPVDRPELVGTTSHQLIELEHSMKMSVTAGGNALQDQAQGWSASIDVMRTVDKVDEKGEPTELTLKFKKFAVTRNGDTNEELPADTVLKASRTANDTSYKIDGEEVESEVSEILAAGFGLTQGEGDENKAFGVDQARKIGEEWDIDGKEMLSTIPDEMPFEFKNDACTGKAKLEEVTGNGESKIAKLSGIFQLAIEKMEGFPAAAEIKNATMKVTHAGDFPLNTKLQPVKEIISMSMGLKADIPIPGGDKAEMNLSMEMKRSAKIIP